MGNQMTPKTKHVLSGVLSLLLIGLTLAGCGRGDTGDVIRTHPPTSEAVTESRRWDTSTNTSRPASCPGDLLNGSMNYEAMMEQQLCVRDLLEWPRDYYPVVADSENSQYVQGMFERDYAFTPMLIANTCAYVSWWLDSPDSIQPSRDDITQMLSEIRITRSDIEGLPEGTSTFMERRTAELIDDMAVGNMADLVQFRERSCGAWSWTQAPDFVVVDTGSH